MLPLGACGLVLNPSVNLWFINSKVYGKNKVRFYMTGAMELLKHITCFGTIQCGVGETLPHNYWSINMQKWADRMCTTLGKIHRGQRYWHIGSTQHTSSHGYNADTAALKYISAQNCVHKFFMAMVTNQYTENKLCKHRARIIPILKDYCTLVQS